eukprot:4437972-Prymnesium_polylepis.1
MMFNKLDPESASMLAKIGTEKRIMLSGIFKPDQTEAHLEEDPLLQPGDSILIASDLRFNSALTSLFLNGDSVGPKGGKAIADVLHVNRTLTCLSLKVRPRDNFGELVSGEGVGDKSGIEIVKALEVNQAIQILDLTGNSIGEAGDTAMSKVLEMNSTLKELLFGSTGGEGAAIPKEVNRSLTTLDLSEVDQDRDVLAKALVVNDTMTSLTLQRSGLLTGGVVLMANALKINRTIAIIDLEGNRFDHDGASAIAATLTVNSTLTWLSLSYNFIGDEGSMAIAKALEANSTLKQLMLNSNSISPDGGMAIANVLKVNDTLSGLDIGHNKLTAETALSIVRIERQRNKLTKHGLGKCNMGNAGAKEIEEWISASNTLTALDLSDQE